MSVTVTLNFVLGEQAFDGLMYTELAAACFNQERTTWEPLLLAGADPLDDEPQPIRIDASAQQIKTAWQMPDQVSNRKKEKGER